MATNHGHDEPVLGAVSPEALAAGHEPDNTFAVKPIMGIPIAVVVTFVIAFSVAAGAFAYFRTSGNEPFAHPAAVDANAKGTNERLSQTQRGGLYVEQPPIAQPRLEPLKRLEKDGMFYARPPLADGNSPEIHPDDIKPDRVAELQTKGFTDKDHKFAKIPIGDAMRIAAGDKNMFPVQKNGSKATPSADKPSASNGGAGVVPAVPKN
jgi:hypothetical protein